MKLQHFKRQIGLKILPFFAVIPCQGIAPPEILHLNNFFALVSLKGARPYIWGVFLDSDAIKAE